MAGNILACAAGRAAPGAKLRAGFLACMVTVDQLMDEGAATVDKTDEHLTIDKEVCG